MFYLLDITRSKEEIYSKYPYDYVIAELTEDQLENLPYNENHIVEFSFYEHENEEILRDKMVNKGGYPEGIQTIYGDEIEEINKLLDIE